MATLIKSHSWTSFRPTDVSVEECTNYFSGPGGTPRVAELPPEVLADREELENYILAGDGDNSGTPTVEGDIKDHICYY